RCARDRGLPVQMLERGGAARGPRPASASAGRVARGGPGSPGAGGFRAGRAAPGGVPRMVGGGPGGGGAGAGGADVTGGCGRVGLAPFLVPAARDVIDEPAIYGPFRMVDAVDRLIARSFDDDFLREIQPELEREKQKVMSDREAFVAWLDDLAARFAIEAKQ